MKLDKKLTFKGGVSGKAATLMQRATRWKTKNWHTGELVSYAVDRRPQRGVMESVIRNQKSRELQAAARQHPGLRQSKKVAAHHAAVRARREVVKAENEKGYVGELAHADRAALK